MNRNRSLFMAVAQELADIRHEVSDLSHLASELMTSCPSDVKPTAVIRMQAFDLLIQRLDGLSELSAALGVGVPTEMALRTLPLTDQRHRLSTDRRAASHPPSPVGDLLLFD